MKSVTLLKAADRLAEYNLVGEQNGQEFSFFLVSESEALTDAQGGFAITRYMAGEFVMGVYRSGYICWSSQTIFNPEGKTYEAMYLPRQNFNPQNGMIIELQPIAGGGFPVVKHARFVSLLRFPIGSRSFYDATQKEEALWSNEYRKRIGKHK